jgi:DNA polymerase elongation subunit (family B)
MSKLIKSQKMIKEGLWTIELMDGTIIQCTNNDDFKLKYNQNNDEKTKLSTGV